MAKLYLTGRSDTRRGTFTSTGRHWIDLGLGYDEENHTKVVSVRLNRPDPDQRPTLWANGKIVWQAED